LDRRELGKQLIDRVGQLGDRFDLKSKLSRPAPPPVSRGAYVVLAYRRFWPATPEVRGELCAAAGFSAAELSRDVARALVEQARSGMSIRESSVAITINGGHRDGYEIAYPELASRGMPATYFLPAQFVDTGDWLWFDKLIYGLRVTEEKWLDIAVPEYGPLTFTLGSPEEKRTATRDLIQSMQSLGQERREACVAEILELLLVTLPEKPTREFAAMQWTDTHEMMGVTFGSLTMTHSLLHTLADGEILAELGESRKMISENTGQALSLLSYPGGFHSDRAAALAENCGYRGAVVNEPGRNPASGDPFRILRAGVEPFFDLERFGKICASLRLQRA
jgi:peptidoglycan/xylan/chitin deacetylase (PgdA/CDA1 family)